MRITRRARRTAVAVVAATAIGAGGVAVGAAAAPGRTAAAVSLPVAASTAPNTGSAGYADVVREVLPSVVLISTTEGLGSGVVLDRAGNIVTNAHVAGDATAFKVQVAGDPAPRDARLVGSYPPDDLAVIRVSDPSGLQLPSIPETAGAPW